MAKFLIVDAGSSDGFFLITSTYQQNCCRFFYKAGHHSKALRHLLKAAAAAGGGGGTTDDAEALNLAIEVVGRSGDAHLSRQLIDYLMGETDGVPKDADWAAAICDASRLLSDKDCSSRAVTALSFRSTISRCCVMACRSRLKPARSCFVSCSSRRRMPRSCSAL